MDTNKLLVSFPVVSHSLTFFIGGWFVNLSHTSLVKISPMAYSVISALCLTWWISSLMSLNCSCRRRYRCC